MRYKTRLKFRHRKIQDLFKMLQRLKQKTWYKIYLLSKNNQNPNLWFKNPSKNLFRNMFKNLFTNQSNNSFTNLPNPKWKKLSRTLFKTLKKLNLEFKKSKRNQIKNLVVNIRFNHRYHKNNMFKIHMFKNHPLKIHMVKKFMFKSLKLINLNKNLTKK